MVKEIEVSYLMFADKMLVAFRGDSKFCINILMVGIFIQVSL